MLSQHENERLHNRVQLIAQHCVIDCMKNVESRDKKIPVKFAARGSRLAACGSRLAARGSRLAARGSRLRL